MLARTILLRVFMTALPNIIPTVKSTYLMISFRIVSFTQMI